MKKTVAHPEIIEKQSRTRIEKLLRACRRLMRGYQKLTPNDHRCPLCLAMETPKESYNCNACPWHTIKGLHSDIRGACMYRQGTKITEVRAFPRDNRNAAAYRARELKWWIEVYEVELERRGPKPATPAKG